MRKLFLTLLLTSFFAIPVASADPLDPWYRGYNEKYFGNELPKEILITHELHDNRFQAMTIPGVMYRIDLNPDFTKSSKNERMLLFHEMCHVRQFVSGEYEAGNDHDYKWQSCMLSLAKKGAFDELW